MVVEIDPAFAKNVGLTEGSKVDIGLHGEPPVATTVHFEPNTAEDWEVIELHASFLEDNLLSQLRALTTVHPLTIYLTPTVTASVKVTKLEPEDAYLTSSLTNADFSKLSPDAEVIVAPKKREKAKPAARGRTEGSTRGTVKEKRKREGGSSKRLFMRGVSLPFKIGHDEETEEEELEEIRDGGKGLTVYVEPEVADSLLFFSNPYATVTVVRPPGLASGQDLAQQQAQAQDQDSAAEQIPHAAKVIARVAAWPNAPDVHHVALSRLLSNALDVNDQVGFVVRLEPAPSQVMVMKGSSPKAKIHPFVGTSQEKDAAGIRWGGSKSKNIDKEKEDAVKRLKEILSTGPRATAKKQSDSRNHAALSVGIGLLDGPLTDGMVLPPLPDTVLFNGGILKIDLPPDAAAKSSTHWLQIPSQKLIVSLGSETSPPVRTTTLSIRPSAPPPTLVSVEKALDEIRAGLLSHSSVLVTGAHLSGKTSILNLITTELSSSPHFYRIIRPPPLVKFSDERIGSIKEALNRWLGEAKWYAGGRGAILVLDDLDRVCVPEQEGMDTARARQVAETFVGVVKKYLDGNVLVLASAVGKEALHSWVVGSKIFRDVVPIKNLDREARRKVLEQITSQMSLDTSMDLVEIAGKTDGYTPGDLQALVGRARHSSLIRTLTQSSSSPLQTEDFTTALEGFLPASLRGVKLQTSGASWEDIGGLTATRQTLLETLEYPTKYAPIFAKSPLRLRSGILLYGYPGCGKTLLASAIASQCGLNFISVKGPEILNKYIGSSEKSVRDLFERAQAARPCVLFFDEFDSIAPKRGHDSTGVTDRVVNQMLTQMDGAEGLEGVYVLAATSRPDLIDPALLRPGRLDKSLICDLPDAAERADILRASARKLAVAPEVDFEELAEKTEGFSGADLQAVLYNAHLEAVHEVIARGEEEAASGKRKGKGKARAGAEEERELEFVQFQIEKGEDVNNARERVQILAKVCLTLSRMYHSH